MKLTLVDGTYGIGIIGLFILTLQGLIILKNSLPFILILVMIGSICMTCIVMRWIDNIRKRMKK